MKKLTVIMMATVLLGTMMVPGTAVAQPYVNVDDLEYGDLIITEIMQDPDVVSDTNGEWFEIYNASGVDVDLENLVVADAGTDDFTISGSHIVYSGDYFLFGRNADTGLNGGISVDYDYDGFLLTNTTDEIILKNSNGVEINRVEYTSSKAGKATALVTAADSITSWQTATCEYGDGDLGTPGYSNNCCNGTCPEPVVPTPELPTILLMSLGLLGLGSYIFIKRRRAKTAAIV